MISLIGDVIEETLWIADNEFDRDGDFDTASCTVFVTRFIMDEDGWITGGGVGKCVLPLAVEAEHAANRQHQLIAAK